MSINKLSTPTNFRAPSIGGIVEFTFQTPNLGRFRAGCWRLDRNFVQQFFLSSASVPGQPPGIIGRSGVSVDPGLFFRCRVPCRGHCAVRFPDAWQFSDFLGIGFKSGQRGALQTEWCFPATALCVLLGTGGANQTTSAILYLAGASANSCWYYLQNWFGMSAGLSVGPGLVNCSSVPYVAISPTGPAGNIILSGISPLTSMLTQL